MCVRLMASEEKPNPATRAGWTPPRMEFVSGIRRISWRATSRRRCRPTWQTRNQRLADSSIQVRWGGWRAAAGTSCRSAVRRSLTNSTCKAGTRYLDRARRGDHHQARKPPMPPAWKPPAWEPPKPPPKPEERLAVADGAVDEFRRGLEKLLVDRLHALLGERPGVLAFMSRTLSDILAARSLFSE